jgi:hypothetical protein
MKLAEWLSQLNPPILWGIFLLFAGIMAVIPFWDRIRKLVRFKFSDVEPNIHDFSWRLTPDHFLFKVKGKKYYLQSDGKDFILEGGKVLLSWNVTGAYQIDLLPIAENVKGNAAFIVARKNANKITLVAHTSKGKLTKELIIDQSLFRELSTFNLSQELHFKQDSYINKSMQLSKASLMFGRYSSHKNEALPTIATPRIYSKLKRYALENRHKRIEFESIFKAKKSKINRYIREQKVVQPYCFHPKKYNEALLLKDNDQLTN